MEEYSLEQFTKDFVKDRDEAFASGDIKKVREYCKKYGIEIPENETIFKAGMHKAICNAYLAPDSKISIEQYERSYDWLMANGFTPSMTDSE